MTTVSSLLARARACGLDLIASGDRLDESGLDFFVLHAHDRCGMPWVVRAPRHANAWSGTFNEANILRLLRARLSLAVPDWCVHEQDLIAYPRLPGTPAWTYDPAAGLTWNGVDPGAPQPAFLDSAARFLAELHGIEAAAVAAAGGSIKTIDQVRRSIIDACESTRAVLAPPEAVWRRWMTWLGDDAYWPAQAALVHGDLHPGHMLLDESLRLTGVLDWTEAGMADAAMDFGIFFGCFGEATLRRMLRLYADAGGRVYARLAEHVVERWAAHAPLAAQWGLENGNADVIEHARSHLRNAELR